MGLGAENEGRILIRTRQEAVMRYKNNDARKSGLDKFSSEDRKRISDNLRLLHSRLCLIGEDYQCAVDLNAKKIPLIWDPGNKKVKIEPHELVDRPVDYLAYRISVIGASMRISRPEVIADNDRQQPGFVFMRNTIEYLRVSNFAIEAYPRLEPVNSGYVRIANKEDLVYEEMVKKKVKGSHGFVPRFIQAGFGYAGKWYEEMLSGNKSKSDRGLPGEVQDFVDDTWKDVYDSSCYYPSKKELSGDGELIVGYAEASYKLARDKVWPRFSELIKSDMDDMRLHLHLDSMQKSNRDGEGDLGLLCDLRNRLNDKEKKELEHIMRNVQKASADGQPDVVDLESLSGELKQQIKDHIGSLSSEEKRQLDARAEKEIRYLERLADFRFGIAQFDESEKAGARTGKNKRLKSSGSKAGEKQKAQAGEDKAKIKGAGDQGGGESGKQKPTEKSSTDAENDEERHGCPSGSTDDESPDKSPGPKTESAPREKYIVRATKYDMDKYLELRGGVLPLITETEREIMRLMIQKRSSKWLSGNRHGNSINIGRRIQEKTRGIPAVDSRSWQRLILPDEVDSAITLLIDCSGSMKGEKIIQTLKGSIIWAEMSGRLAIKTEILGFNRRLMVVKPFYERMSDRTRVLMGGLFKEAETPDAVFNDDGWAIQQASERLGRQIEQLKYLLVFSDGRPFESEEHSLPEYKLEKVILDVMEQTDQKIIGLGIGKGTRHVAQYYPYCAADIELDEMPKKAVGIMREIVLSGV